MQRGRDEGEEEDLGGDEEKLILSKKFFYKNHGRKKQEKIDVCTPCVFVMRHMECKLSF